MREIEELIAEIAPKPDVAALIRAVPVQGVDLSRQASLGGVAGKAANGCTLVGAEHATRDGRAVASARKPRGLASPLSPRRYKLQVTIGQDARDTLVELQNLLSHQIPDGDPAAVVERALDVLLTETKKKKGALADKPRVRRKKGGGRTRAIPAHVRRDVFQRDAGRCAFVDGEGRRCESGWQLEFHHCIPYGREGPHSTGNIELRCRAHNQYEAELEYGQRFIATRRRSRGNGTRDACN